MPKILFLNIYYQNFLDRHYRDNPHLLNASYEDQKEAIIATMFPDSDFYSHAMKQNGWEADDIITNCSTLQKQWAVENDPRLMNTKQVLVEQIRKYAPDVVYSQGVWVINERLRMATDVKVFAAQNGLPLDNYASPFIDVIFTTLPTNVEGYERAGVKSHLLPLAFDPRALEFELGHPDTMWALTFIGGLSAGHTKRRELLEVVSDHFTISCWGYGFDELAKKENISYHGEAWGKDMFKILRQSYMTLNCHIDSIYPYVGNMRMFEATGCGAMLFTDDGANLLQYFDHYKEVVIYQNPTLCVAQIENYIHKPNECLNIAKAGQRRTLREHTYKRRMSFVAEILEEML